jgi:uncharacterized protein (DUF488 family)
MKLWTIGHSTRTLERFLAILGVHGIETLVDVRRFPASRRHPQYDREALAASLERAGIEYYWMPELGGRRTPRPDSHNTAWHNSSFRGYADYMETDEFGRAVERLKELAGRRACAIMCAEAVWWQCHRALIADYLTVRGVDVLHIIDKAATAPHPYTAAAQVTDGKLSYQSAQLELGSS